MTKRRSTAGIVSAIRNGTKNTLSSTINFIAKLSEFEAVMLCIMLGSGIGWFVGGVL
jgi:2-keto-3-deoxy-galactonokinase